MNGKAQMNAQERKSLKKFRSDCAKRSQQEYDEYKRGKIHRSVDGSVDITGDIAYCASHFYAAIHNRNKMKSLALIKAMKTYQESVLDVMLFQDFPKEYSVINERTGECRKGETEAVRLFGKDSKEAIEEMKEVLMIAMNIDNEFGYWK
jgi:hypothetical protein